jgi:LysR family nod box-dependent transcriptional activator
MALDRFNLNLLFALDAILNSATLTEAAGKTHLTQPAMSVSLKKLRGIFGDQLVAYRSGGETRFTSLALSLRPRTRHILQASRELIDFAPKFDPARDAVTVRIASADVIELIILGPLLTRIRTQGPNMRLLSLPFGYQPMTTLFERPLDIAIVAEPFASPLFAKQRLFSETMSCMVWRGGPYADGLTEHDFFAGKHVGMIQSSDRLTHPVGQTLQRLAEGQDIVAHASGYAALPHAIIGTDLIATTLTSYARLCATMLPVEVVPLPIEMPKIDFVAQWQEYRAGEPLVKWLLAQLHAVVPGGPAAELPAP